MDKRFSSRKIVHMKATLTWEGASYHGFIENISEQGFYFLTTSNTSKAGKGFSPGSAIEMELNTPSGKTLNVNCQIIWSYKTPPHELTNNIGLEIISPSSNYMDLYSELQ